MKKRMAGTFLIAVIIAAGFFWACESKPQVVEKVVEVEKVIERKEMPPPPLVPLTREIIDLALKSENSIKNWQYYISEGIVLEYEKNSQRVSNNSKGDVTLQDNSIRDLIDIPKETQGVLANMSLMEHNPWALKIRFGTNNNEVLLFKENSETQRFELDFNGTGAYKKVLFADVNYVLNFNDPPFLQIRLSDVTNNQPNRRTLPGVSVDAQDL